MAVTEAGTPAAVGPSQFNVVADGPNGELLVWNTLSGAFNVFDGRTGVMVRDALQGGAAPEKLATYLRDRGLLADRAVETEVFRERFARDHHRDDMLELILLASEDCNFRCRYCYEAFARGTMRPDVRRRVKALVERRAPSLRTLSIAWFGGEPLYGYAAIADLAPFFLDVARRHDLAYVGAMTTNGFGLTPEVATQLLGWGVSYYQITLDGPAELHDAARPTRDGGRTFATILGNLRALARRDDAFRVSIRVNFDRENLVAVPELLDQLRDEFAADRRFEMMFRAVGRWGGPQDADLDVCGMRESQQQLVRLAEAALDRGMHVEDTAKDWRGTGNLVCYAARPHSFVIGADGKVMKCTVALDRNEENIVGSLTDDGQLDLIPERYAQWVEPAHERDTGCQKCKLLPQCQGVHCPLIRIEEQRRPCPPFKSHLDGHLKLALRAATHGKGGAR